MPLPRGQKHPPPDGYTGNQGKVPTKAKIREWIKDNGDGNIAIRMRPDAIGIDVDVYDGKTGDVTLAQLEVLHGELPASIRTTARGFDNPSGIRWFTIPKGLQLPGKLGPGIEVIQFHHRYAMVADSWNPKAKSRYQTFDDRDATEIDGVFRYDDLPELPESWHEVAAIGFEGAGSSETTSKLAAQTGSLSRTAAIEWVAAHGAGEPCRAVKGVLKSATAKLEQASADGTSRYDTAVSESMALLLLASEGHRGVRASIKLLGEAYKDAVSGEVGRDPSEWSRMVTDGVGKVAALTDPDFWEQHADDECPDRTTTSSGSTAWPSPSAPLDVAKEYVKRQWTTDGVVTLKRWRGDFYRWVGTHYVALSEEAITAELYELLADAEYFGAPKSENSPCPVLAWRPSAPRISHVVKALVGVPGLLVADEFEPSGSGASVALANGVLTIGQRAIEPHSPERFALSSLPFDYSEDAACPLWREFLSSLWPGDHEAIELLQEWFGYVVSGDIRLHKMLMLGGVPRSGKGTIARTLEALVGHGNHSSPTLDALGTNFGLQASVGKSLIVVSDARFDGRNNAVVVERLLTLVGGDTMQIDRKNRDPWIGRNSARLLIVSNELPILRESSGALIDRFIGPLETATSWLGREDVDLGSKIETELTGILNWSLDGLDRLREQGNHFTRPESSRRSRREWSEMNAPVLAFLLARCQRTEGAEIERSVLYSSYVQWCRETGHQPTTDARFGRDLKIATQRKPLGESKHQGQRHYVGVELTELAYSPDMV